MNQEQTEQALAQLADRWATAEAQGDIAFLEQTLADDFVGVGPLGFLLTKQQWLARHRSGEIKYTIHALDDMQARTYNGAAIIIGRLTQEATYQGNPINAQLRTTVVFIQQQGQWRLAGLHFCSIGQPPAFARS